MRYQVSGAHKDTAARMVLEIEAPSKGAAEKKASQQGMNVHKVEELGGGGSASMADHAGRQRAGGGGMKWGIILIVIALLAVAAWWYMHHGTQLPLPK